MVTVRARYEDGLFRAIEPVGLVEGQDVELIVVADSEVRRVLKDLISPISSTEAVEICAANELELERRLTFLVGGAQGASDAIIEERRTGP